jgi:GT2 family glycosyltransferase
MKPRVCAIVTTYNKMEALKNCLQSLQNSKYDNLRTIVVDNASTDATGDMVRLNFPLVKLIQNKENSGYTGGNNIGIRYEMKTEPCDYILIVNDDVIIDPNAVNELVDEATNNPKAGIVNPKIIDFESRGLLCNCFGRYNFYLGLGYKPLAEKVVPEKITLLRGTCFLLRTEAINRVGLMDENFFLYFDEADLSFRMKKSGYSMIFLPAARVYHQISHSFSGHTNPVVLYYSTRNELLFARKHLNMAIFWPFWISRFVLRVIHYFLQNRDIQQTKFIMKGLLDFTRCKFGQASF